MKIFQAEKDGGTQASNFRCSKLISRFAIGIAAQFYALCRKGAQILDKARLKTLKEGCAFVCFDRKKLLKVPVFDRVRLLTEQKSCGIIQYISTLAK